MVSERRIVSETNAKGTRILAKSFFKELRENGYTHQQILALSTELIDLVTREVKSEESEPPPPTPIDSRRVRARARDASGWRHAL